VLDVIIVGAGPAGLTAGFKLRQKGAAVVVLEEAALPGGNIKTISEQGFRMETGPHTFMGSSEFVFKLVRELTLEQSLLPASAVADNRYIFRDGKLMPLPGTLGHFIKTPLLSGRAKLRLMMEPFIPNGAKPEDTAWQFFVRRFGEEAATYIMSPFISGIYAGDARKLGARASFPKFWNFERESGSMIIGAAKFMLAKRRRLAKEGVKQKKGLFSFNEGLGTLTAALGKQLGDAVVTGVSVEAIKKTGGGYSVHSKDRQWLAKTVVVAVPPRQAAQLLGETASEASKALGGVGPMAPVALIHWSLPAHNFPAGFGFLMPRIYDLRVLGTLFPSQLFENRAPSGKCLFASFYGGALDPGAVNLTDAELTALLFKEHEIIFGTPLKETGVIRILRYQAAIPQLLPNHPEVISNALQELSKTPGVFLAGNYLTGVGMEHAVASGYGVADQAWQFLSGPEGSSRK
jgi:protoporphyrinogen/coproporphyrinogen III oxidase